MAVQRKPRGTREDPARIAWNVERAHKKRVEELARRANVTASVFFEKMVDHLDDEIAANGLPTWWPETTTEDGELPIDSA